MNGQFGGARLVKEVQLNDSAKAGLIKGINTLADAVGSTLGAGGRTVILENDFGGAHITKDGVTVAESIVLADPVENLGVTLIKQAAQTTATKAGDGTTTSTVLAQAIIKTFMEYDGEHSFRDLRNGAEKLQDKVLNLLDGLSVEVDDQKLRQVSIISANNDEALGTLISDAFIAAGPDGVVTMATSKTGDTYIDTINGTKIDSQPVHHAFMTNQEREIAELDKPLVFLSSSEIPTMPKITSILEKAVKSNRSILIVSPTGTQVTQALAMNKIKGNIKVLIVDCPSFGLKQVDILSDLALLTGATVYDESLGDSLDNITVDMLGEAVKVVSDKDGTVFFFEGENKAVDERIVNIKKEIEDIEDNPILIKHLQARLALLKGGVSQIYVGADTEAELKEKQDRTDDAIQAVKAAKKEGILPGGGAALGHIAGEAKVESCCEAEKAGVELLRVCLLAPFYKILDNAGLDLSKYLGKLDVWGEGVDAIDGKTKDMLKAGIIDPTTVTKEALKNAVSVAMTILSTDAVVSNVREV